MTETIIVAWWWSSHAVRRSNNISFFSRWRRASLRWCFCMTMRFFVTNGEEFPSKNNKRGILVLSHTSSMVSLMVSNSNLFSNDKNKRMFFLFCIKTPLTTVKNECCSCHHFHWRAKVGATWLVRMDRHFLMSSPRIIADYPFHPPPCLPPIIKRDNYCIRPGPQESSWVKIIS